MTNSSPDPNLPLLKILLVEDDQIDHLAFTRMVRQAGLPYNYTIAWSMTEALEILHRQTFEIAVLDYNLGDGHCIDLFPLLKTQNCPFIISTGSGDEEIAAQLMTEGASGYLIKDPDRNYLKVLPSVVDRALSRKKADEQISLLTRAIESVEDSIYIADMEGNLLFINTSLRQLSGFAGEQIIGCSIESLGMPELTQRMEFDPCHGTTCSVEVEITFNQPDGTLRYGLLSESFIRNQHERVRVGVIRDITSLKQMELELRNARENLEQQVLKRTVLLQETNDLLQQENLERIKAQNQLNQLNQTLEARVKQRTLDLQISEERSRSVIESLTEGVVFQQADGKIIACNQSAERILGLTADQLMGLTSVDLDYQTIREDGSPFPAQEHPSMVTLRTGQSQSNVIMGICSRDRLITWIAINSRPLYHPDETQPYAVVASFADITEQLQAREILQWQAEQGFMMAMTDGLTQVPNRRCFDEQLQIEWQRLMRSQEPLSLIMLDVDYFKRYNDHYGHQLGDTCLIQIAKAAQKQMQRPADFFARYGGEEFGVVLPNTDKEGAIAVAQSIQNAIRELQIPHKKSDVEKFVTVSMGIASFIPSSAQTPNDLIALADNALYQAKIQGRNCYEVAPCTEHK